MQSSRTMQQPTWAQDVAEFRASMARGDVLGAEAAGQRLLAAGGGNASLYYNIGLAFARLDLSRMALPHFRRAAALRPADGSFLVALGQSLVQVGAFGEGEKALAEAMAAEPAGLKAPLAMARLAAMTDRRADVTSCFARALAAAPPQRRDEIERQWLEMRVSWGDMDAVAEEIAPRIDDGSVPAALLALFVRLRKSAPGSAAAAAVTHRLAAADLARPDRIALLHAAAAVAERGGDHRQAFASLAEAKSLMPSDYHAEDFEAYVDRMAKVMTRPAIEQMSGLVGDPDFAPVIVAGVPRSGTTLTEQILLAHPEVGSAGEASPMRELLMTLARSGVAAGDSLESAMRRIGLGRVRQLRDDIRQVLGHRAGATPVIVDKTPQNFMTLHLFFTLFPATRVVHCFRDPADNFLSAYRLEMSSEHGYSHSPAAFARYYRAYVRLMRHWRGAFSERILALRYEALVSEPEPTVRALLGFLDLAWTEACLSPQDNRGRVSTPSNLQVRSPINTASVGSARPYALEIGAAFRPEADFAL